jgi:hypothetical protein
VGIYGKDLGEVGRGCVADDIGGHLLTWNFFWCFLFLDVKCCDDRAKVSLVSQLNILLSYMWGLNNLKRTEGLSLST